MVQLKCGKAKKGGEKVKNFVFVVERAILPSFVIKYARFRSQESMSQDLNNLLDNESGSQVELA